MSGRKLSGSKSNGRSGSRKAVWWILVLVLFVAIVFGGRLTYIWLKAKRSDQFAAAGDALVKEGKWNDGASKYRVALQLDPHGYHALVGAARLASAASRPEALGLWQQVMGHRKATVADKQDYADLLIKSDRLSLAEKVIDPLLKNNPNAETLELAARYSKKIGDDLKAIEFARLAVKRSPNDDAARFQLADLLAKSTDPAEQADARRVLWELANKPGPFKQSAVEALARAPVLSADERNKLLQALEEITPKNVTDDLLAAEMRVQLQPEDASRIYDETIDRWRNSTNDELISVARWLNGEQQPERVLSLFSVNRAIENNQLLLTRLDALASLQRWAAIDEILARPDITLDPSVVESFRARTAQERGAALDAEVHWNHAISLAGTDPAKLRFVANFAEQSRATAPALNAYEQLARFPEQADLAYRGIQRASQRSGDAAMARSAAEKIANASPEDPNASAQLAYLNLLLDTDVDPNFATAKKLAEKYPNRLWYRVTLALGYLRRHDAGSALAQFNGPAPIDWKRTLPAWRAVYAATLLTNDRKDEAQAIIATIPKDQLTEQERELIEAQ